MAPVIWGLDLKEIQWWKFKSSYMFKNRDYHLRRTKFAVYQCALIFCVISESLGTAALSNYLDAQDLVKRRDANVYVYNNDYIGVASYNIFAGVFVAFIFGAAFFFDLFWPARNESKGVRIAWKVCGILSVVFYAADAFALTVVTARHCQYFRGQGVTEAYGLSLLSQFKKDGGVSLCYRDNSRAIAAVVFAWPGFLSVIGRQVSLIYRHRMFVTDPRSCILLFLSIDNAEKGPGPYSQHAREGNPDDQEACRISDALEKEKEEDGDDPTAPYVLQATHQTFDGAPAGAVPVAAHPSNSVDTDATAAGKSHHQHTG